MDALILVITLKIPRPDEDATKFFKSILPKDPQVTLRPMFGNLGAIVNGNMFMGLLGMMSSSNCRARIERSF